MVSSVLAISVGASLGALLRWVLSLRFNGVWPAMPLGTLAANLVGGLLVGIAVAFFDRHPSLAPEWRLLAITGFLGGLTTFSTYSAEVVSRMAAGDWGAAALTATTHLVGSLTLTGLGIVLVQKLSAA